MTNLIQKTKIFTKIDFIFLFWITFKQSKTKFMKKIANERTFQGIFISVINSILEDNKGIKFSQIFQELNVGIGKGHNKFSDGLLQSAIDKKRAISFELKNSVWDASDERLVSDACSKASNKGYKYFVTGTPRQMILWETFREGTPLLERKIKIFDISTVKKDDEILSPFFLKDIRPKIEKFLQELSDITHDVITTIQWDSIDKLFVNKLSDYILEATESMHVAMHDKISADLKFQKRLTAYLKDQDVFNVSMKYDVKDTYNICQLANYLLYLKILFYTHLQRDLQELRLKPIEIPEDRKQLNKVLRGYFNDVLKHDFQKIFEANILEEFEFTDDFIPELKRNVKTFEKLDFTGLNADIIGSIYNTLIDNQEQHDRGQHFTNINEVDIVNAFCIRENTKFVIDSGCGAGTFLVRAYFFLKKYSEQRTANSEQRTANSEQRTNRYAVGSPISHEMLLERIWGVEIAAFPVFLSTMNLCLLDFKSLDNYPCIIHEDFIDVSTGFGYKGYFLNKTQSFKVKNIDNRLREVKLPMFDACVGNPPYIRQELILRKKEWLKTTEKEWGIKKINQQSDLYVYYLMHTASFLSEGGRLGYVISSSWLDVSFGTGLQKFLLDNFKIIAIIDHQKKRSFETASVNTVILILEKCSNRELRENSSVRFVRFYADYEKYIGNSQDQDRFERTKAFAQHIESINKDEINKDYWLICTNQKELELSSTFNGKYLNGNWGAKYLRAPEIYYKIIKAGKDKLVPLSQIATLKRGFTTGANDFFYLIDNTSDVFKMTDKEYKLYFGIDKAKHLKTWDKNGWYYSEMTKQHHIIERKFIVPIFKTQREANNLDVDISKLKGVVFMCDLNKNRLANYKYKALEYIELAEKKPYEIDKLPSTSGRELWYSLSTSAFIGDFIFPSKIGEYYRLIDNRETGVYCDKVNYAIKVNEEYECYSDIIFAMLNSITFRYFIDLFSRQLTGAQTLSDVDVNVVEKTLVLNPIFMGDKIKEINKVIISIKNREQGSIYDEVVQEDKQKLDSIIFECLGLSNKDVKLLYQEAEKYVDERSTKSKSVKTSKTKQVLTYDEALQLIKDRFSDIRTYQSILKGESTKNYKIPLQKAKYPKDGGITLSMFEDYNIYFPQGDKKTVIKMSSKAQISLFRFFNEILEHKGDVLKLPIDEKVCQIVFDTLQEDFDTHIEDIKHLLKTHRSKANPISIYKDLILK